MRFLNSCVVQQISILQTGVCVRQSSPNVYARLLVFDKTLTQSHFVVENYSDALMKVFYPLF